MGAVSPIGFLAWRDISVCPEGSQTHVWQSIPRGRVCPLPHANSTCISAMEGRWRDMEGVASTSFTLQAISRCTALCFEYKKRLQWMDF